MLILVCAALWLAGSEPGTGVVYAANPRIETYRTDRDEYSMKAAFLVHFVYYTEWPKDAFKHKDDPILVTVVGRDPFGTKLEDTFEGRELHGRRLEVKRIAALPEKLPLETHVAFCALRSAKERKAFLEAMHGRPVLTVGEFEDFAADGAAINFYLEKLKVRFEINRKPFERGELKVSSELLKLARLVEERKPEKKS